MPQWVSKDGDWLPVDEESRADWEKTHGKMTAEFRKQCDEAGRQITLESSSTPPAEMGVSSASSEAGVEVGWQALPEPVKADRPMPEPKPAMKRKPGRPRRVAAGASDAR